MATLLRQGAMRIGVSMLQQTQAAVTSPMVAKKWRWLVPRCTYSTEEQAHGGIEREIQQKIDELYDLINKAEDDARTSTLGNAWLLPYLSEQVTPRWSDSDWRAMKGTSELITVIKRSGLFSLIFMMYCYCKGYYSNDKKVALAMLMEEEHESSEVET